MINMKAARLAALGLNGVLADFEGLLVEFMRDARPIYGDANRHLYDLKERYGEWEGVYESALAFTQDPNAYYGLHRINDGFLFLKELLEHGFMALIITSRPVEAEAFTVRWLKRELRKYGMRYEDLLGVKFIASDKEYDNKADFLRSSQMPFSLFVDDNPDAIFDARSVGIPAYSWAQPWNEHVYPKLFRTRDGYTMVQDGESKTARYFWEDWS